MSEFLQIERLIVGQMSTNCYLLTNSHTKETFIIDPGDDADYIERIIDEKSLKIMAIVCTHGHFDHCLSVFELKLAYNVPFYLHEEDRFLLSRMRFGAKKYLGFDAGPIPKVEKYLRSHEEIRLGELKLLIIHTPGHTPGSICLYHKNSQTLITGDLIFADGGVGRTDFPYSDLQKLNDSLNKIFKLPGNLIIYPGHGNSSLLEKEKNYYF